MGDVMVSLWSLRWIHHTYPDWALRFICRKSWEPLVQRCTFLDSWVALEDFMEGRVPWPETERSHIVFFYSRPEEARMALKLNFRRRTGTAGRWWHWLYSNERIFFSRRHSPWHETQLNLVLVKKFLPRVWPCALDELSQLKLWSLNGNSHSAGSLRILLHPFSNKSAPLWPRKHWISLLRILGSLKNAEIFVSGLSEHQAEAEYLIRESGNVKALNVCGQFNLEEFIRFIATCHSIAAPSTGPLHVAAALGLNTIGLFVPRSPMHPGRWAPIGPRVLALTGALDCSKKCIPHSCSCMEKVAPEIVAEKLIYGP